MEIFQAVTAFIPNGIKDFIWGLLPVLMIKPGRRNSPATKPISACVEHYQQAADYVTEHCGITIGTIMRLYRLSSINASEIFQRLIENKVVDESGRIYRIKKEL